MAKRVPDSIASAPPQKKMAWVDNRALTPDQKKAAKATPPGVALPIAIDEMIFQWSAESIDHEYDGSWNWDLGAKETRDLLELLSCLHGLTWREVKEQKFHSKNSTRQLHHKQSVSSICREAQKRLDEIGRGDQAEVFRLRHGNTVRVWGLLETGIFRILWYDRSHQVYPSEP
ncbi:hypothetical protein [Cryobacterium sp. MDB2-33-2]|uniref:hypothetical protein n=1 Tax=Cryobacterium sp. MDB2-33-2 TaxID=1259179 RepID=UPI00106C54AD|nr:hypothetical protein [Cryobacterium sp. MDB2-33-2]TFC02318.1 hypothetical protein E3O59_18790 [Cryobacterium sp. MDB2-33-2]